MKNSILFGIATATLLLSGCNERKNQYIPPPPPIVTVEYPSVKTVTQYAEYPGYTEASEKGDVEARVTGFLEKICFRPSQYVEKGQVLFEIEKTQYAAEVAKAEANLEKAKADLQLAEASLLRKQNALKDNAISEIDVLDAQANVANTKAGVKQAESMLIEAKLNLSYCTITAPVSGYIGKSELSEGNLINAKSRILTTIMQTKPIFIYFSIGESDLNKIIDGEIISRKEKAPLEVGIGNKGKFKYLGYFDYIANQINITTGTILLRGIVANENNSLLSGSFVRVRFIVKEIKNALLIPEDAVMTNQRGNFIYTVNAENVVQSCPVEIGIKENNLVQITSEKINKDSKIITVGLLKARPGSNVTPEFAK